MRPIAFGLSVLLLGAAVGEPPGAERAGPPRVEPAPCSVPLPPAENVQCMVLFVPEHRTAAASRTIRIPVERFPARTPSGLEPVLFMIGGPAGSVINRFRSARGIAYGATHDIIVLEQRGAGFSDPSLRCPQYDATIERLGRARVDAFAGRGAQAAAAAACRHTLEASGADLRGYTTAEIAADVEDLRTALGISRWNLAGVSYSTTVFLEVARRYPQGVRTLLLDSVLPPDVVYDEHEAENVLRSLHAVFAACEGDPQCGAAYPDLEGELRRMLAELARHPVLIGVHATDGAPLQWSFRARDAFEALYDVLNDAGNIRFIPKLVHLAANGQLRPLAAVLAQNLGVTGDARGMRLSVLCADQLGHAKPAALAAQHGVALAMLDGFDTSSASPEVCRAWRAAGYTPPPPPVSVPIPTLVLAGEFDPNTPPQWGLHALATLSNGFYVELRGQTHGAGSFTPCGLAIEAAFIEHPEGGFATDCALRGREPTFAT